jgi:hypothetical protein
MFLFFFSHKQNVHEDLKSCPSKNFFRTQYDVYMHEKHLIKKDDLHRHEQIFIKKKTSEHIFFNKKRVVFT